VTLCDTGPLVALLDRNDARHEDCRKALPGLTGPLVTTWACLAEAMHLLGRAGGHRAQDALWALVTDGLLLLHEHVPAERGGMRALMARFWDTPMDLGDASLVSAAETLGLLRVFTLDSDFLVYRTQAGEAFEPVPPAVSA
jgi:predicted nucleic acid-binding protein